MNAFLRNDACQAFLWDDALSVEAHCMRLAAIDLLLVKGLYETCAQTLAGDKCPAIQQFAG
ncbi:MAG: hypothetical protein CSA51_03195 [Gammaproteobacteria bacterium]|nr:MAG: hypothetical protein CSA51_03195 [Gammaproteobacteria bacterium]